MDDVVVESVALIKTETATAVLFGDNSTWVSRWTRLFLDYAPYQHAIDTLIDDGGRTGVRAISGTIDRAYARRDRDGSFRDGTLP